MSSEAKRIALPWSRSCFVCGEANPRGLRARSYLVDDRIELEFVVAPELVGWMEVTHGGIIATVLDEVMTWAAIVEHEIPCFAAEFSVRLRRPLPPRTACIARAKVEEVRRRVVHTAAELVTATGVVHATATGRYMGMPASHETVARYDFVTEPGCWPVEKILQNSPTSEES